MKKRPRLDNLFNFISFASLLVIAVLMVRKVNFSSLNFEVPEFKVPNYSAFFMPFSQASDVQQTIASEYGNLSRLRVSLNFIDNFNGVVLVQISDGSDQSLVLFSKKYWFEGEEGLKLLDIKFKPLRGKRFWLTLSSEALQGAVQVGYEPDKNIYSYGSAIFRGAKDGDDLVFDSYTTISGEILREAAQDFATSINNDRGFFVFYSILLGLAAFFAIRLR